MMVCNPQGHYLKSSTFTESLIRGITDNAFDAMREIFYFLGARECSKLCLVSKWLKDYIEDEVIWNRFTSQDILSLETESEYGIEGMRVLLGFPSYKVLYGNLWKLNINLIGCHRLMPPYIQLNGGFYISSVLNNLLVFRMADHHGKIIENDYGFTVYFDNRRKKLIGKSIISGTEHLITFDTRYGMILSELTFGYDGQREFYFVSLPSIIIQSLPTLFNPPSLNPTNAVMNFDNSISSLEIGQSSIISKLEYCLGLYRATYGSHGLEIIHMSLHSSVSQYFLHQHIASEVNFGDIQLHGLKITGDPNIPASKISFCIDINAVQNIAFLLENDNRLAVGVTEQGEPHLISIHERMNNMVLWIKGFGQINRDPLVWNPEWVSCNFILYRNSTVQFSILWDDGLEPFRHIMDFVSMDS
eukprot:gene13459-18055_t